MRDSVTNVTAPLNPLHKRLSAVTLARDITVTNVTNQQRSRQPLQTANSAE